MISEKLKKIILNELNLDEFEINDDMKADEVPGWDSLNHINIILAVENEYNIRFKNIELLKLKNIGELQHLVDQKIK
jgi:acyl carrier protein